MRYFEKHPQLPLIVGILGVSLSSILVRFSAAPSAVTAAWRLVWTVLLMTPMVFTSKTVRRELFTADKKLLLRSCLSGLFLAIHFAVWFESLQHTTVASGTTIVCTEVIWVAVGFCLFLGGKLSWKAIAAIGVSLVGSVMIALSDSATGGGHLYGDILALFAAVAAAVYMLLGRQVQKHLSTTVYTYVAYCACAATLLLLCAVQGHDLFGHGAGSIAVGLGLAVCSTLLGHSIFSWCLKFFTPSFVSASKLCEPVVAAILAVFLFGEYPAALQLLGSALILGSVFWYSRLELAK